MSRIKLTCETCSRIWDLEKTNEIPLLVFNMHCNWCPDCEDKAQGPYEEWWDDDEENPDPDKPEPLPDDPNQLVMPFIFDELEINSICPKEKIPKQVMRLTVH